MILVDTSVWVEFDRGTGSPTDRRLTELIATTDDVAVTEPIIMEVIAGARDHRRERDLRRLMARFVLVPFDPISDFDAASRIYLACRRIGVTPRGMLDCMIAAVAWRSGSILLAADRDLEQVARVMGGALDGTSTPASPS